MSEVDEAKAVNKLNIMADLIAKGLGLTVKRAGGPPWNWSAQLVDSDGEDTLNLRNWAEKDKIAIGYDAPRDMLGNWHLKEAAKNGTTVIRVSINRGTDVMIREINRRLMPSVQTYKEVIRKVRSEQASYDSKMQAYATACHEALGTGAYPTTEQQGNSCYDIVANPYKGHRIDAKIHPMSDGEVDIKLDNVPIEAALNILRFIRDYKGTLNTNVRGA